MNPRFEARLEKADSSSADRARRVVYPVVATYPFPLRERAQIAFLEGSKAGPFVKFLLGRIMPRIKGSES
jgi:hypothetical protein